MEKTMTILDKFNRIRHKHSEVKDFCIKTIRFKKLLENATALLDLFEDGNEKLKGEYILDGHYVTSLIDDIIDRLNLVVYDACTLAPEKGQELYAQLDKHKSHIINQISQKQADDKQIPTSDDLDPEYQLLSNVLDWFNGVDSSISVKELMKLAMAEGISGINSLDDIKQETNHKLIDFQEPDKIFYFIDLWKDPLAPLKQPRALKDTDCLLLKRLFAKTLNSDASPKSISGILPTTWITVASAAEISLCTIKPDINFRLDAAMSGHEDSNYIFIFADNTLNTDQILPSGFDIKKTVSGTLAWKRKTPASVIEENLVTIGENLFSTWKIPD